MYSIKTVKKIEKKLHVNPLVLPAKDLKKGMLVETEHKNITHDKAILSAKIALAHIGEDPLYYKRLDKMESGAKKYWKNKPKPKLYL
jgi:hypothetical protein